MSRIFSLSLVTLMMLTSLLGAAPQSSYAQESTPVSNPTSSDAPTVDVTDQDEAIEEVPQLPADPPEEETQPLEEQQGLEVIDEPAEDANAPPIDESSTEVVTEEPIEEASTEVVTEEAVDAISTEVATEAPVDDAPASKEPTQIAPVAPSEIEDTDDSKPSTPETMKIAPNAVDPNPGDCDVDEICDGGGGDETPESITVSFSGVAIIEGTDVPLTNLSVEVFDESAVSLGTQTTGDDGVAQFDLTVGETYTFNMSAEGYAPLTGLQVTVTENMETVTYLLEASPGSATITVIDSATRAPIEFASVVFTDNPNGDYQSETDANGVMSFSNLTPGTYSFTVSEPGYATQVITVTVTSGQDTAITVELAQAGDEWMITVVNSVTGQPVPNADLWLHSANGEDQFAGGTNSNGVWLSPRIADGDFVITVHHDDYVIIEDLVITKTVGTPTQVQMQPYLSGNLALTVTDLETGAPIANAQVSIVTHSSTPIKTYYATTGATGQMTSPTLQGGNHELNVHADGYIFERRTITIVDGDTPLSIQMQPKEYGRFYFTVINAENGRPEVGVTITVTLRGGVYLIGSGMTEGDGTWVGPTTGWAEYQYTIEKRGFKTVSNIVFVQGQPFSKTVYLEHGTSHEFNVTVNMPAPLASTTLLAQPMAGVNPGMMPAFFTQVNGSMVPVVGARVSLHDIYTNEELHVAETGLDGIASFSGVWEGRYRMVISADGMQTLTQLITVGEGATFDITIDEAQDVPEEPGDGDGETPTDPEPGDGDGETPTDPEPGDGDNETPTDPEPGDGDAETPTNPVPGDGDNETPTNPEPGDGDDETPTNPVPDDVDDQTPTSPEPGTNPLDPAPSDGNDVPVSPGQDDITGDTGDPTTDGSDATEDSDPVAESGQPGASDAIAQSGSTSTDSNATAQADAVSELPSAGSGSEQSQALLSTMLLLVGGVLIIATAIRRRPR